MKSLRQLTNFKHFPSYIIAARTHVQRRDSKSSIHKDNKEEDCENIDEESTIDDVSPANNDESKDINHANQSENEVNCSNVIQFHKKYNLDMFLAQNYTW